MKWEMTIVVTVKMFQYDAVTLEVRIMKMYYYKLKKMRLTSLWSFIVTNTMRVMKLVYNVIIVKKACAILAHKN